jgi:hypothetical protein
MKEDYLQKKIVKREISSTQEIIVNVDRSSKEQKVIVNGKRLSTKIFVKKRERSDQHKKQF